MRKLLSLLLMFTGMTAYAGVATQTEEEHVCPRIETCFSPIRDCSVVVKMQLASADYTLDLALYSLTKDDIAQAIIDAHKRGVRVRVIMDRTQAGLKVADDEKLEAAGITVKRLRGMKSGLMHHKFAIVDGKTILTGSYNWTKGGTYKNSENMIILDTLVTEFQIEFNKLWNKKVRRKKKKK